MNKRDYAEAWDLISSWRDDDAREVQLEAFRASERRPYVVIAMIKFAAMLSNSSDVAEGFSKQLVGSSYAGMDEGILNVTDQIMIAVDPDIELLKSLARFVDVFAEQEMRPSGAEPALIEEPSPRPAVEKRSSTASIRLDQTPVFSRVRVTKLGSMDTSEEELELLGATVITWTAMETSADIFAEVEVRGVLTPDDEVAWIVGELSWLSGDAEVEVIEPPRYAGQPEDLIPLAQPVKSPPNVGSPAGWPPLIWTSHPLYRAMAPLDDPLKCIETILCALSVAPDVFDLRPFLLGGLKARYARFVRDADLYPPRLHYWRHQEGPTTEVGS